MIIRDTQWLRDEDTQLQSTFIILAFPVQHTRDAEFLILSSKNRFQTSSLVCHHKTYKSPIMLSNTLYYLSLVITSVPLMSTNPVGAPLDVRAPTVSGGPTTTVTCPVRKSQPAISLCSVGRLLTQPTQPTKQVQGLCTAGCPPVVPEQWLGEFPARSLIKFIY